MSSGIIGGLGGNLKNLFKGAAKIISSKTDKPQPRDINRQYPFNEPIEKRILWLLDYYYREGSFEKLQFSRKWMRNALIYQGYHELEWSEINVAWDVVTQDSGDYAFPNNYYRSLLLHGVRAYLAQESLIEPIPANDDADAEAAAKAAKTALEVIKKAVKYDWLRVLEAINLRLFGNSFRFSYYSQDPRFGYISSNVYQDSSVVLSHGGSICPQCGPMEGSFYQCPTCGAPIQGQIPPIVAQMPQIIGNVKYPKGEIITEAVNPLETYVRSSSYDLWHAPFLVRNRVVDRMALQSQYQDKQLAPAGDEGGGEAYSTGGDLGLIYLQSLADIPGDPTQFAAWYERATSAAKALLIEGWLRPAMYFFDKDLRDYAPDGLYGAKTGETLLESRNDTIEDHWTHYVFIPVPGRIWGDGDDDLIPGTLKLDECDRLIQRNQGYNAVPLIGIDSQRIDKNDMISDPSTIVEIKSAGRPIKDAWDVIQASPLPQETWNWRAAQIADMQFHSKVSPTSIGMHETGVNTFGGQESSAAKSDSAILPQLLLWAVSDGEWARQALKLASENWLDNRVLAVEGINGKWEFEKLKGSALDMDKFTIKTRVLPIDPAQQESLSQAVASGLLNPQDPRVKRKAMELYHLPRELDEFYMDSSTQWKEIEEMEKTMKPIQPMMIRDNDAVHLEVLHIAMNSDKYRNNPQMMQLLMMHGLMHMQNMSRQMQAQALISGAGDQAQAQTQPQQPTNGGPRQPGGTNEPKQKPGGQVPKNPVTRRQRAEKGQAAKPHRPQPSEGNQYARRRLT